jgi:Cu(I)/Ag(I) efflux system membrane fusion protein
MNKFAMLVIGAVIGAGAVFLLRGDNTAEQTMVEEQPLYWVAPMDPEYRREGPGKSPMGMDLVPVYEDRGSAGEISISPFVENNLGVRTAQVEMGPLHTAIRTVGYVRFDEDRLLHMHPRVEGWIEELNVKTEGEFIQAGQPVYSIYSPILVNAQEELVLALDRNNERLVQSAEERLLSLQVPQSQIDRLKTDREVLQTVTIFAPQDGLLAELGIREGHFVQPGSALMSIGVLDEVWVIAEVFERQASLVSEGDLVTMSLDYLPGRDWQGEVDFIYPTLNAETRTVQVRLRFQNADLALKPNMFAQVTIHSDQGGNTLLVPNEAVIRSGERDRVVLAMGSGRFKSVEVAIGRRGDTSTEVLEGLEEGDSIVTSAQFLLDSESSISSDFMRMDSSPAMDAMDSGAVNPGSSSAMVMAQDEAPIDVSDNENMDMGDPEASTGADSVWAKSVVQRVMGAAMISVTHDPIPEWEWPAMTMMFEVAEGVDISDVEEGETIELEITRQEGGQIVTGIRPATE